MSGPAWQQPADRERLTGGSKQPLAGAGTDARLQSGFGGLNEISTRWARYMGSVE
jgi:hypothetical protein